MKKPGRSMSTTDRQHRYFSEEFKRKKVSEIDNNTTTVSEVSREYEVTRTAIYKWKKKYSRHQKQGVRQIVEVKSDTRRISALQEQVKELERQVGQKQIKIEILEKTIELAEEDYGIEIKKMEFSGPCSGSLIARKPTGGR
jgi:transposase-like protein